MIDNILRKQIEEQTYKGLVLNYLLLNNVTMNSKDLTFKEKEKIVLDRIEHLKKTNWQRWVPILSFYHNLQDIINDDNFVRTNFMPKYHPHFNIFYNQVITAGIISAMLYSIFK